MENNALKGKTVLFVGDSLCEAYCEKITDEYGDKAGWAGRIMKANGMGGLNRSLGGASLSDCRGANTVINQLIDMTGNEYDYLILEGGGNDAWDSAPVGEITEGFEGPFDTATFAGGFENTIKYAKDNFKNSVFGYIVTFTMPAAEFGRMSDMSEYFALSKKICEKWEIPYLDLYFDEDLNKNRLKTHLTDNLPDHIHPNTSGYDIITPVIEDWMKTL